jgi:hypothetical protein
MMPEYWTGMVPAGERDHPRAEGEVAFVERRPPFRARVFSRRHTRSLRPVSPFR